MLEPLAIAFGLLFAAMLAFETGMSSAVLEVVAGLALAMVFADIADTEWMVFLADIGMLALMFLAGFDLRTDTVRDTWRSCLLLGLSAFFLPFGAVMAFAYFVLGLELVPAGLVAVALSTTSLALVYHALKADDMIGHKSGQIILAGASIVDVLSMVALALLLGDVGWGTATFIIMVVVSLISLPRLGTLVFRRYRGAMPELELRFLLVILIGMGFMGEEIGGIHPAIVAFAIGVAMSGVVAENSVVHDKLNGIVFGFLAPVFFLHAGSKMQILELEPEALGYGAMLLALALGMKYAATFVCARISKNVPGHYTANLFNYRLTFGIIAAEVGLRGGHIEQQMYDIIMLVILIGAALPFVLQGKFNPLPARLRRKRRAHAAHDTASS
jgi:Kef-type K+ transport system membrane component KefB